MPDSGNDDAIWTGASSIASEFLRLPRILEEGLSYKEVDSNDILRLPNRGIQFYIVGARCSEICVKRLCRHGFRRASVLNLRRRKKGPIDRKTRKENQHDGGDLDDKKHSAPLVRSGTATEEVFQRERNSHVRVRYLKDKYIGYFKLLKRQCHFLSAIEPRL